MGPNESILFIVSALFINNIVLTQFLGLCSFFGVSNKSSSALGMGLSVVFVITLSAIVSFSIYYYILVPYNLVHLKTVVFILVISGFVQILELFIKKASPSLYKVLGIYLPLITTNCTVMGVVLINITKGYTFYQMILYSVATAMGYFLVIYLFSFTREQILRAPVPKALKGIPIALFTAGLMSLTMSSFK